MTDRSLGLVLLDGANEFDGLSAVIQAAMRWPRLRREMRAAPGYVTHQLWVSLPFTVGILSWWEDEPSAYRFAHQPAHLEFWEWAASPGHTRGGWLAFYGLTHGGPLWGNGVSKRASTFGKFTGAPTGEPPRGTPAQRRAARRST